MPAVLQSALIFDDGAPALRQRWSRGEREKDYPEPKMFGDPPACGVFIRHVKGIELSGIAVSYLQEDLRPAFYLDDVRGATLDRVKAQHAVDVSAFVLKKIEEFSLHQYRGLADTRLECVDLKRLGAGKLILPFGASVSGRVRDGETVGILGGSG